MAENRAYGDFVPTKTEVGLESSKTKNIKNIEFLFPDLGTVFVLSDDSKFKITSFYTRFCLNGDIGHLLFACHAAFPMILSARLVNILWLNFGDYEAGGEKMHVQPVAVSDVLLSSMVRSIGHGQMELIPEIRLFLLYLLSSENFFSEFGVDSFKQDRLSRLSRFLLQYFANGALHEYNAERFKQVNEWAAYSYEDPEHLAMRINDAFAGTFSSDGQSDENAQLALNVLMNKFNLQFKLNIMSEKKAAMPVFDSLYQYSGANRNVAFGENLSKISSSFSKLQNGFLSFKHQYNALPILAESQVMERLARKKNKIRRVFPVFDSAALKGDEGAFFGVLKGLSQLKIEPAELIGDKSPTALIFFQALQKAFDKADGEDLILIVLSDQFEFNRGDTGGINPENFRSELSRMKGVNGPQVLLISSQILSDQEILTPEGDIQISCSAKKGADYHGFFEDSLLKNITFLLKASSGQISYRDLRLTLQEMMKFDNSSSTIEVVFYIPKGYDHYAFLSLKSIKLKIYQPMLIFNPVQHDWHVVSDKLMMNAPFSSYYVSEFNSGEHIFKTEAVITFTNKEFFSSNQLKNLKQSKIYRIESVNNIFPYILDVDLIETETERELQGLISGLSADRFSGKRFSRFQSLEQALENGGAVSIKKIISNRELRQFEVTYFLGNSISLDLQNFFQVIVYSETELRQCLVKTRSFDYFVHLSNDHQKKSAENYAPFSLFAGIGNSSVDISSLKTTFTIGQNFYVIKDGQFELKPLNIVAEYHGKSLLYFDLYLVWSDLTIELVKISERMDQDHPKFEESFSLEPYFDLIYIQGKSFFVKAVIYESKVDQNFSQKGFVL